MTLLLVIYFVAAANLNPRWIEVNGTEVSRTNNHKHTRQQLPLPYSFSAEMKSVCEDTDERKELVNSFVDGTNCSSTSLLLSLAAVDYFMSPLPFTSSTDAYQVFCENTFCYQATRNFVKFCYDSHHSEHLLSLLEGLCSEGEHGVHCHTVYWNSAEDMSNAVDNCFGTPKVPVGLLGTTDVDACSYACRRSLIQYGFKFGCCIRAIHDIPGPVIPYGGLADENRWSSCGLTIPAVDGCTRPLTSSSVPHACAVAGAAQTTFLAIVFLYLKDC